MTEGQHVAAGQPLVRMNGVKSGAAAEQAQAKRDALRALQARLIAERDGLDAIVFPDDLMRRTGTATVQNAGRGAVDDLPAGIATSSGNDRSIAATDTDAAEAQRASAAKQLALINDELASIRSLYRKGFARLSQVRALERSAAELEGQRATAASSVAKSSLTSAKLVDQQVMDVVGQLNQVDEQLAQVDPALRAVAIRRRPRSVACTGRRTRLRRRRDRRGRGIGGGQDGNCRSCPTAVR